MTAIYTFDDLLPWQKNGARWLASKMDDGRPHKALYDDPGLGKTPQTMGALMLVKAKSALIVSPPPIFVRNAWKRHLIEWGIAKEHQVHVVTSTLDTIPKEAKFIIVSSAVITYKPREGSLTWNSKSSVYHQLRERKFDVYIRDESHELQNFQSKRSNFELAGNQDSLAYRCFWKWFLSGTPGDRPIHLFPILATCAPSVLGEYDTYDKFGRRYCGGYAARDAEGCYRGSSNETELSGRLSRFMLRRRLYDVYPDMPETIEREMYIDIGDLPGGEDETNTEPATLRKLIGIAKIPYVIEYLEWWLKANPGKKAIVFTYHREVSERLFEHFGKAKLMPITRTSGSVYTPDACLIYGGQSDEMRQQQFNGFIEGEARLLFLQMQSGGTGVDGFQHVCHNVIHAEPDWSGQGYKQQIGRLLRHGQEQSIYNTILIAEKKLEDRIVGSRRRKIKVMSNILDRSENVYNTVDRATKQSEEIMPIETQLAELIAETKETNKLLAALVGGAKEAPKPEAKKEEKKEEKKPAAKKDDAKTAESSKTDTPAFTEQNVRDAAKKALLAIGNNDENKAKIKGVMQMFGAEKLEELKSADYAKAIEMYGHLEKGTTPPKGSADDDLGI